MTTMEQDLDIITAARRQVLDEGVGLTEDQVRQVLTLPDEVLPELKEA